MKDNAKVTIRDVAKQAGVSISSVSRFLNDEKSVRPVAAYKIREAINELQYVPDTFARNMRSKKSNAVGIVLPHTRYFWGSICNIVTSILFDHGYACYICVTNNDGVRERRYVHELTAMHAAGIIIVPCGQNTRYLQTVSSSYNRMVQFDSTEFRCDTLLPLRYTECAQKLCGEMMNRYPQEKVYCVFGFHQNDSILAMERGVDKAAETMHFPTERLVKQFNCRVMINIEKVATEILQETENGGRPVVICFGANFTEALLLILRGKDSNILNKIHLAGFTERESYRRIGYEYPCIFREDQACGVLLANMIL